ncbi:hypothetical protein PFICI_05900 [Pestalotiopsis fici W106-1]|uniref:NYN domain-containing protein n=1 Tax=Pestalotiopsis fici (strain W106-1 / CGMCC3.15140) TaxID=1229662 RepID=W3XDD3_PESFW|nr:uncharacterized protein PFICI_05900 [Pestalotiopsis fici W106-1]ETS84024.1 hypothetical protein PFICI_05900 [Pestalotiopsis fici W106-1]
MVTGHIPQFVPSIETSPSIFDDTRSSTSEATSPDHSLGSGETSLDDSTSAATIQDKHLPVIKRRAFRGNMPASNDIQPRLGFGSLDINSIVDYGTRPKTPDAMVSPISTYTRMRLATPPHTPEQKQLGLSAGLDHAVALAELAISATARSPVSAEHTEIPRANPKSLTTYIAGTLRSSPRWKSTASGVENSRKDAVSRETSPSVPSHEECHEGRASETTKPADEDYVPFFGAAQASLCQPALVATGLVALGASEMCTDSKDPHTSVSYRITNEDGSTDRRRTVSQASPMGQNDLFGAKRSTQKPRAVTNIEKNHYLEALRAAVQPKSDMSSNNDSRVHGPTEIRPVTTNVQTSGTRTAITTPSMSGRGLQTIRGQGMDSWLSTEENVNVPPTPKGLSQARGDVFLTTLNDICTSSLSATTKAHVVPRDRSAYATAVVTTKNIARHPLGEIDIDEDDEVGGCPVLSSTLLPPVQSPDAFKTPFSRKIPSLAEQQIQDMFRAQVQQAATFGAHFQPMCHLTKEQKFDNLLTKMQGKHLFDHRHADETARDVHCFVDMSNIFIGFQDTAKTSQGLPSSARVTFSPFSFEHLAFVLERGRNTVKRRLAGSVRQAHQMNKLPTHIADAQAYGYDCKILHQVVKLDLTQPLSGSPHTSGDESRTGTLCPRTKLGEQGVDEALHLSMQDSILDAHGKPGIMVLGTGDAKPAEYSDGFAHYAIKALKHGWQVEVVSWRKCLSGEWKKSPFKDKYAEQFRIIILDDFFNEIHATWSSNINTRPSAVLARA